MSIWDETKAWYARHPHWDAEDTDTIIGVLVLFALLGAMILALLEIEFLLTL